MNELAAYAAEEDPDFILLTETWCNVTINNAALSIPGYQLETDLRRDRENRYNKRHRWRTAGKYEKWAKSNNL